MKVVISNKYGLIESAFSEENDACLSLYINTTERWVEPSYTVHGYGEIEYVFYVDYDNDDDDRRDSVTFIAEDDIEAESMQRISFECHEKEQLWFLFLDRSVYAND